VQKGLWAGLAKRPNGDGIILATRWGFHGKKGLSGAVTGSETDKERDPRVRFISFPKEECRSLDARKEPLDLTPYRAELEALKAEFGDRLCVLITEPYLGGGGSFHPPLAYHRLLERFCREHDLLLIFDEVQANFGRTGSMYAFEKYDIEPDMVVLGKGLGNGVPVAAVALGHTVTQSMGYGSLSDTWSANPLSCAAVVATLDEFEQTDVLANAGARSRQLIDGLQRLKATGVVAHVRGEGMVFGLECAPLGQLPASDVARALVRECYLGEDNYGVHLLGPLAGKVLRVSPPLTITEREAEHSLRLLEHCAERLGTRVRG
jgi:4-aminobutyrate aminotransferase-like enzyme